MAGYSLQRIHRLSSELLDYIRLWIRWLRVIVIVIGYALY